MTTGLGTVTTLRDVLSQFKFLEGQHFFSSSPRADRRWGIPAFYPIGIRGTFPDVKWPEREADHSQKLGMRRAINPLPPYVSMEM
jgi:hypothetical protein